MNRRLVDAAHWVLRRVRKVAYDRGHRPRPGTLLFSPSMDLTYGWRDAWLKHQAGKDAQ